MDKPHTLSLHLLLAVFLTGVFAFLQVYSIQSILPLLLKDLGSTEIQAGLAVGATIAGIALMSPFTGMLSDAYGRKRFISGSLLFLAFPTALLSWAQTIEQIIAFRFLQGLVIPGITVVLIAYIADEFKGQNLTRLMSLYVSGTVFGGFMGRFLTGHLSALSNWRSAFLIMAAICIVAAIWIIRKLPASRNFIPNPNFAASLHILKNHLHNRHVLAACGLGACVLFSLVGCFTYVSLYLGYEPYSLSSSHLANIFALYLIGMFITPLSAKLIKNWGNTATILTAIGFSAIGVAATLQASLPGIIIALVIMSTGVFITQSATISYIATHVKEGRSLASGLYYMCYYGGGTLGSWICGYAYQYGAWQTVVGTLLAVQMGALILVGLSMRKEEKAA